LSLGKFQGMRPILGGQAERVPGDLRPVFAVEMGFPKLPHHGREEGVNYLPM
jgi:hypothetical protein